MAIYRNIQMSFWTDTKIVDDFTPAQKLLYLYLMTNPHTNLCGCYEISFKQVVNETGLTYKQIKDAFKALQEDHKVIIYSEDTKEVLIVNWSKYNWTASEKYRKPLEKEIVSVKDTVFRQYLIDLFNGVGTVSIPYPYGMDTTDTVTDTDTISIDSNKTNSNSILKGWKNKKYSDNEDLDKAIHDFIEFRKKMPSSSFTDRAFELAMNRLDGMTSDDNEKIAIINQSIECGWKSFYELKSERKKNSKFNNAPTRDYDMEELERKLLATN